MIQNSFKYAAIVCIVSSLSGIASADAQNLKTDTDDIFIGKDVEKDRWSFHLGAGAGLAPTFEGSDDYEFIPFPLVDIRYRDRFFLGIGGVGVNLVNSDAIRLGARFTYNGGREEDDDPALAGLGDVDKTVEAGFFGSVRVGDFWISTDLRKDIAGGHEGLFGTAAVNYTRQVSDSTYVILGPNIIWADNQYMDSFFGVSPVQSVNSGYAQFDADGGVKDVGFGGSVTYALNAKWSATAITRYKRLLSDAADSPITETSDQGFAAFYVGYRF